jgi:hypothetical protein
MKLLETLRPTEEAPLVPVEETPRVTEATAAWRSAEAAFRTAQDGVRALNAIGATGDRIARVEAQQALPHAEAQVAAAEVALAKATRRCETARDAEKTKILAARHPGAVELAASRLQAVDVLLAAHDACMKYTQATDALLGAETVVDLGNFTLLASQLSGWRQGQA